MDKINLESLLLELLAIPSPTFKESRCVAFVKSFLEEHISDCTIRIHHDSLICNLPHIEGKPHIALVGHSDVVPDHVEPRIESGRIYGAGASDMKGADACFMALLVSLAQQQDRGYNISFILYAREEGTKLIDNGLYDLIEKEEEYFKSIDLAIVGEPTNMTVQLGCVGSCHANVAVVGKESHSARPWDGDNALYKALPIINYFSNRVPKSQTIFDVTFNDVMSITESHSDPGRTTIPGKWQANINYRFPPGMSMDDAEKQLIKEVASCGVQESKVDIIDNVPAGHVIESPLFKDIVSRLECSIEAKQAWTDVAQLTALGIPSFNFGPGLTDQAHRQTEYILQKNILEYYNKIKKILN